MTLVSLTEGQVPGLGESSVPVSAVGVADTWLVCYPSPPPNPHFTAVPAKT